MRQTKSLKMPIHPNNTLMIPASNPWVFPTNKNINPSIIMSLNDPQEQIQIDHNKAYRLLYQLFNHNFYKFVKTHKNCLGDIQQVYKSKLFKQQDMLLQQQKQKIFHKHFDRLKRQMHFRNSHIQKNINSYQQNYKPLLQSQDIILIQNKATEQPIKSQVIQLKQFSSKKTSYRPFSSTIYRNKPLSTAQSISNRIVKQNHINFNKLKIHHQNQLCKSANIQTNSYQSCGYNYNYKYEQINKIKVLNGQSLMDTKSKSFYLQNQQIYINERHTQAENYQSQRSNSRGFKGFTPNFYPKSSRKQQQIKLNYRKLLQEKEKEIIKNKIFMINSALAVNLAKSQGYKPKSQIWQKQCY